MNVDIKYPYANRLLADLPRDAFNLISSHLIIGPFAQSVVLTEAGDEVEHVYFPLSGMISLVIIMRDGKGIETATVGRDGAFGAMAGVGLDTSKVRAIVQMQMVSASIASSRFRKATQQSKALLDMCIGYNETLLTQAWITAACNALHKVEARFCRWLLQTRNVTESDTITLTQEFLSEMLGVRRTSVADVAIKLSADGVISYTRGVIRIIDLPSLEALSCECYDTLLEQKSI